MGYGGADDLRQHFTGYERDAETGLDFAQARYYSGASGRFTSPDPLEASASALRPQSWNRYAYTYNNPLKYSDPSGMLATREPIDYSFRQTGAGVYGGLETASSFDSSSEAWVEMQQRAAAAEMVQEAVGAGLFGAIAAASVPGAAQQNTPPQDNRTVCERMADDAQSTAEMTRNEYPRATGAFVLQQFNKAYGHITFGAYFSESPLGFLGTPTSSGRNPNENRNYEGDSGFYPDFRDTKNPGEDQVHHFGAYFSAGLAGHKAVPDQHRAGDRGDKNWGDVKLADQARWLGVYLRNHPNQLNRVGQLIRDSICQGKEVPK